MRKQNKRAVQKLKKEEETKYKIGIKRGGNEIKSRFELKQKLNRRKCYFLGHKLSLSSKSDCYIVIA